MGRAWGKTPRELLGGMLPLLAMVAGALWTPPLGSQPLEAPLLGEPVPCEGRVARGVEVTSSDLARSDDPLFTERLIKSVGVPPGSILTPALLDLVKTRLEGLEVFKRVILSCRSAPEGGAVLLLQLKGRALVSEVRVSGVRHLYESDVLKRTYIRVGQYLEDSSDKAAIFESQRTSIETLYEREGFEGTKVTLRAVPQPGNRVRVEIDILPGRRRAIRELKIKLEEPEPASGCPRFGELEIEQRLGLRPGEAITPRTMKKAQRAMQDFLWSRGVADPRVRLSFDPKEERLLADISHRRCHRLQLWTRSEEVEGAWEPAELADYAEQLTFRESGAFDWEEAEITRANLAAQLRGRGYVNARVTMEHRLKPVDPDPGVQSQIDFFIDAGPRPKIAQFSFEGNAHLSDEALAELVETREYSWFSEGGYLLVDQLFTDLARIAQRYRDDGYDRFRYTASAPGATGPKAGADPGSSPPGELRGTSDTRERQVLASDAQGRGTRWRWRRGELSFEAQLRRGGDIEIRVFMDEGPARQIVDLRLLGAIRVSASVLRGELQLGTKLPLSDTIIGGLERKLERSYSARGFSMMRYATRCAGLGADGKSLARAWGSCEPARLDHGPVALRFEVDEGPEASVGEVFVFGNRTTRDAFIRKNMPAPGAPYDVTGVDEGVQRLRNAGVFSSVHVRRLGLEETPPRETVTLAVEVEESPHRFVDFAVGFETINRPDEKAPDFVTELVSNSVRVANGAMFGNEEPFISGLPDLLITGEVAYTDRNFLGAARQLYVPLKYGFSITDPFRYASFSPTYTDPFFTKTRLTWQATPFVVYDRATEAIDKFVMGAKTSLSKSFLRYYFASIGYEISSISYRRLTGIEQRDWSALALQNKVNLKASINRLDNPVNPTRGSFLGLGTSYLNAFQNDAFRNFVKWDLQGKAFFSIRRLLIVGSILRYADSRTIGGGSLPVYERYKLGGSKGLRGYVDDAVVPYERSGEPKVDASTGEDGALVYSMPLGGDMMVQGTEELRFPLWRSVGLWGAVFFDWGGLAERMGELYPASIRTSAGLGIRWLLGGQIPLRLDYGFKLERRCQEVDPADRDLCLREEDPGALHFGFLYTF